MISIGTFLAAHWMVVAGIVAYFILALINNMPKPGASITRYEYFYNVIQTIINNPIIKKFEDKYPATPPPTTISVATTEQAGTPPKTVTTTTISAAEPPKS